MENAEVVSKLKDLFSRGLRSGEGVAADDPVCVEQAINLACHGQMTDSPACVSSAARTFSIRLNDSRWSSPAARANGMWELALAQIGTAGALDDVKFARRLAELTIRRVVPIALRAAKLEDAATRCEREGTRESAIEARRAYAAAYAAADDAADAADAAAYAYAAADDAAYAAAYAADAAAYAYAAADDADLPLIEAARCAVEAIREQLPNAGL